MLYTPPGASVSAEFSSQLASINTAPPNSTTFGVTPTTGFNTYGAYSQIYSAISTPAYGILLYFTSGQGTGQNYQTVFKVGVDLAGGTSYTDLITNIMVGSHGSISVGSGGYYYYPMYIPAGASIGVSSNSSNSISGQRVAARLMQYPSRPEEVRFATYSDSLGLTGSNTYNGTVVTPGSSSEGSWTSIGTTTRRLWWWHIGWQYQQFGTWVSNTMHIDLAVGDGTNFDVILSDIYGAASTTTANYISSPYTAIGAERDLPAGSTLYVRAQGANATPLNLEVSVIGCGGG